MHDCLKIAELVDMICSQFDCSSDRQDQGDLAALARTCMTFKDPAMDHLWRSTTLGRLLIVCMPSDLWAVERETSGFRYRRRLSRPICAADWQRVRLYAPRIRKLASDGRDSQDLEEVFPSLIMAFPGWLLQNLQDLRWYHYDYFYHIHTFLRPSLTKISFHLISTSHCSLLPRLRDGCPKLAHMSITAGPDVDLQPLSQFVAGLPHAGTISVPWLKPDALEHLSKLPTLKSLKMGRLPEARVVYMVPAFPALRCLVIHQATLTDMTEFLRMCRDVPLETLTVERTGPGYPLAAEMHGLFTALAARVSHSTLTSLLLEDEGDPLEPLDPAIYLIQPNTLVPLLCFKNLTSVHFRSALGFDLDDDTVSRMASAWPRIETLYLAPIRVFSASRPRTTLASLYSISRHCPRILALTMAFDGSDVPSPSMAIPRNESLRQLYVLHSPITTPIAMGRCLSGVFPNLDRITTSREGMHNDDETQLQEHEEAILHHRCWKQVWDVLEIVRRR
ncbi:hypothetical protein DFH06DRAFT_1327183 [Mycena polygramma]|nr:hypothetical protein DFH06DRAFT_1327183 [Mycena polygramma]